MKDPLKIGRELINVGIKERDSNVLSENNLHFMGDRFNGCYLLLNQPGRRWIFSNKLSAIHPLSIKLNNKVEISINESREFFITKLT
ncbi:hypothetical protein ACNRWW_10840 [Metabacillus sp. HB246100]